MEGWFALDLIVEDGRCLGVVAADARGRRTEVRASNVLVATGGYGQLFAVTTNPEEATGDGVAMAVRAGVAVADIEFEQFHPTALHHPVMPRPLLTEALRGHGALLRDAKGERFVDELLSRDKVSKEITARMLEQDVDHLWLDATGLERFAERFPTIAAELSRLGLDPSEDWLPIAPAAHYSCGGILADLNGSSSLPGLWVAGEASCNGVMGANRLASNSLLDGMVFGPRVVEAIDRGVDGPEASGAMRALLGGGEIAGRTVEVPPVDSGAVPDLDTLQRTMTTHAGVLRSAASLELAAATCAGQPAGDDPGTWELRNLVTVGRLLCAAALAREESRGTHNRTDFERTRDDMRVRFVAGG
jgi:L-aspartate oxidase